MQVPKTQKEGKAVFKENQIVTPEQVAENPKLIKEGHPVEVGMDEVSITLMWMVPDPYKTKPFLGFRMSIFPTLKEINTYLGKTQYNEDDAFAYKGRMYLGDVDTGHIDHIANVAFDAPVLLLDKMVRQACGVRVDALGLGLKLPNTDEMGDIEKGLSG